jgi:hypothetical protein
MAFTEKASGDTTLFGSNTLFPPSTGKPKPQVPEEGIASGPGINTPTTRQLATGTGFTAEQLFYDRYSEEERAGMSDDRKAMEWAAAKRDATAGIGMGTDSGNLVSVSDKWGKLQSKAVPEVAKGGGRGSTGVTFEGQIQGQVDPEVQKAHLYHLGKLADAESAFQQARSNALQMEWDIQGSLAAALAKDAEGTYRQVDDLLTKAETEMGAVEELVERAQSNRINPGQFFANVGEAGSFAAALAVGAGAMATAFGGGPNVAYQIIEGAIERNVRAQIANQQHDRAMISHQLNFVSAIRGLAGDRANLGNLTRVGLTAIAQAAVAQAQAGLGATQAGIASLAVYNQLGAKLAEAVIASQQNIGAKYKIQAQTMSQASAMLGMITQQQAAAAQLPRGRPPSAGGGPGPRGRSPAQGGESRGAAEQVTSRQDFTDMSDQQKAEEVRQAFQTGSFHSRQGVNIKDIESLKRAVAADPALGPGVAASLETVSDEDFAPRSQYGKVSFNPGIEEDKFDLFVKNPRWHDLSPKDQGAIITEVGANAAYLKNIQKMRSIIGMLQEGSGFAGKLVRRMEDGSMTPVPGASKEQTTLISTLTQAATEAAFYMRTKRGKDAVRGEWELAYFDRLAKGEYGFTEFITDLVRGDSEIRQARLNPYVSFGNRELMRSAHWFHTD